MSQDVIKIQQVEQGLDQWLNRINKVMIMWRRVQLIRQGARRERAEIIDAQVIPRQKGG